MCVFARLDLDGHNISRPVRDRWHGKIVQVEPPEVVSLDGRQAEGLSLSNWSEDCLKPLSDAEMRVAFLLEATFWVRDRYTEDVGELDGLLRQIPGRSTRLQALWGFQ